MQIFKFIILILFSYFFGNISFARIVSSKQGKDITKSGSGNPGTMNMLRTNGVKAGLVTLLLDVLKGAIPTLFGLILFVNDGDVMQHIAMYTAGLSTIIGHIYPICYKFKGGKGVACAIGIFLVANPIWLLVMFAVSFMYLWFFDYGSIASFIIVSAMIIIEGFNPVTSKNIAIPILLFFIFASIIFAHRENIYRLLVGKENKANLKKSISKQVGNKKKQSRELFKQELSIAKGDFSEERQEFKEIKQSYKTAKQNFTKQNVDTKGLNQDFRQSKNEYKIKKARYKQELSQFKKNYNREMRKIRKGLSNQEIVKTTLSNIESKENDAQ